MSPLAIDLFCGLGGWSEGLISAGWECIGFDIERHDYGAGGYPGQLVLQDVLTLHGSQFRNAHLIVASPPCQGYSYRAMPWSRAKALPPPDNSLFDACFRIQKEACEAAGRYIPMVVENVRGAQKWTRRADWNFGSYYLWGDVPALMPKGRDMKNSGGQWFPYNARGQLVNYENPAKRIEKSIGNDGLNTFGWSKESALRDCNSKSFRRKAASAQIAKIPFALSSHIGRVYHP